MGAEGKKGWGKLEEQGLFKLKRRACARWGGWGGVTLPGKQAIKCAAWASHPLVSGSGHDIGSCLLRGTRTAKQCNGTEQEEDPFLHRDPSRKKEKEGERGQTLHSVDLAFQTLL